MNGRQVHRIRASCPKPSAKDLKSPWGDVDERIDSEAPAANTVQLVCSPVMQVQWQELTAAQALLS